MDTTEPTPPARHPTHEVFNQPPPLEDYNPFATDQALTEALRREGAGWSEAEVSEYGRLMGSRDALAWGYQANRFPPLLRTHDRYGQRIDEVEFHPAWHELMRLGVGRRLHCLPWGALREGAHAARAALLMLAGQTEAGHCCPLSMTYAAVPVVRLRPELAAAWEPKICSRVYDPRYRPAGEKDGVLVGMAMTEKQGGSDVRANTTRAVPAGGDGSYALTGHKWFCSAPMSDAFLVLAQAPGGLSCFFVPRWTPEGRQNPFFLQRLKDKLGNRSNASAEVEFEGTLGWLVGDEGRGVRTIMRMADHTRLDCAALSAALLRQGAVQALHHTRHRSAFGRRLADHPLMRNVLADLCLESEAATALVMRLARAYDHPDDADFEGPFRRVATALAKYWVCKRAPAHAAEALECLGGNGYVEESPLPRLFRESPLNSIWEGSANVICLDVLRALRREPGSAEALLREVGLAAGADRRLDACLHALPDELRRAAPEESQARLATERVAVALQGALLVRHAPPAVADAFCASRLSGDWGRALGTLPVDADFTAILERAWP
jgi:putative acyl-CoA dehydrogenase